MFETLEDLNRTFPRPELTGDPLRDRLTLERYISHARVMRSEAFACIGRALVKTLRNTWRQLTTWDRRPHTHQA